VGPASVAGENRIELVGPSSYSEGEEAKGDGVFTERIDYRTRYFVPANETAGPEALRKLTQYSTVVELGEAGARPETAAEGDEPMFSLAPAERARVISGAMQGARLTAPESLFKWLGLPQGEFFANFAALHRKHRDDFASPQAARDHVLDTLSNADTAIHQKRGTIALIARSDQDKFIAFDVERRQGRYLIVTAYPLTRDQYDRILRGAERDGALTVRRSIATPEGEAQSRGVPRATRSPEGDQPQFSMTSEPSPAPLFNARPTLTPKAQAARSELEKRLSGIASRLLGSNVRVEFSDTVPLRAGQGAAWGSMAQGRRTAAGAYYPAERLIRIALSDPQYRQPGLTAYHEAFHALEHLLLTDAELAVLKRAEPALRRIAQRYAGLTDRQAAELADFEVRALAFEAYAHARAKQQPIGTFPATVRAILEKLRSLFDRIRKVLHEFGFTDASDVFAQDVFREAYEGRMAGRQPQPRPIGPAATRGEARSSMRSDRPPGDEVVAILRELAKNDDLFAYPRSDAKTIEGVMHDIEPSIINGGALTKHDLPPGIERGRMFEIDGHPFYVLERGNEVWVNLGALDPGVGGNAVYAAVANYAYNTGRVFVGDPEGVSDTAVPRRTDAMLSSALKHETTRHLAPDTKQLQGNDKLGIPPLRWQEDNDEANIRSLIETSVASTVHNVPEIRDANYDAESRTFRTAGGDTATDERVESWAQDARTSRGYSVGHRTLKRAMLLQSLLHATRGARGEGGRNELLVRSLAGQQRGLAGTPFRGIFYSAQGDPGKTGAAAVSEEPGADGRPQTVIPGAEKISDKELAERRAQAPKRSNKPQQTADGLPLFAGEPDPELPLFSLKEEPKTYQERQRVTQGLLARGQYLDRALRVPFDFFGGITRDGQWRPGQKLTELAGRA
jgi:hypothetical protein